MKVSMLHSKARLGRNRRSCIGRRLLETGRVAVLAEWQRDGCKPWEAELTELPPRCGLDGGEPTDRGGGALFVWLEQPASPVDVATVHLHQVDGKPLWSGGPTSWSRACDKRDPRRHSLDDAAGCEINVTHTTSFSEGSSNCNSLRLSDMPKNHRLVWSPKSFFLQ